MLSKGDWAGKWARRLTWASTPGSPNHLFFSKCSVIGGKSLGCFWCDASDPTCGAKVCTGDLIFIDIPCQGETPSHSSSSCLGGDVEGRVSVKWKGCWRFYCCKQQQGPMERFQTALQVTLSTASRGQPTSLLAPLSLPEHGQVCLSVWAVLSCQHGFSGQIRLCL